MSTEPSEASSPTEESAPPLKEQFLEIWNDNTKRGGLILIAIALAFDIFAIFVILDVHANFMQLIIGIVLIAASLMMMIYGFFKMRQEPFFDPEDRNLGRHFEGPALVAALNSEERPFWLCSKCRVIFTTEECHGVCMRCDRIVDLHKVESDNDLAMAIASVT